MANKLEEEMEGDIIGTKNYRYIPIGDPVPILNTQFDPHSLPSQPLAVSERFRLLFVAHPHGFCVTRTKDVMASAEEIKSKKKGQSVGELSLVDVRIGKVLMLMLSDDEASLAVVVESDVHVFAVSALLHKEQKPSYTVSVEDSSGIKEMKWGKKDVKGYLILSENGKLYHGSGPGPLTCVMESVDSVDWSVGGNFVAVAKKDTLTILTLQFKEKLSFTLQFGSVVGDSDVNQVIKVDSVRWVRPDCIAVGCFELNENGNAENYVVQLITSRGQRITDADYMPIALSFNSVFIDFRSDAVPVGNRPHMFLSYLARFGVAFIASRNLSLSVGLFSWSMDNGKNEAVLVEILDDSWCFHVNEFQENDEENVLLGLCVDKVSQYEDIEFTLGDEEVEVSPCCVIVCVTIDGKISLLHFASAIGASSDNAVSEEEHSNEQTVANSESHVPSSSELRKSDAKATSMNQKPLFQLDLNSQGQTTLETTGQNPTENIRKLEVSGQPKNSVSISPIHDRNVEKQSTVEVSSNSSLFSSQFSSSLLSGKFPSSKDLPDAGSSLSLTDATKSSTVSSLSKSPIHDINAERQSTAEVKSSPALFSSQSTSSSLLFGISPSSKDLPVAGSSPWSTDAMKSSTVSYFSKSPIHDRNVERQSTAEVKSSPALVSSQSVSNSSPFGKIPSSKDLPGAGSSTWSTDAISTSFLLPTSRPVDSDKRALQSAGVPQNPIDLKDKISSSAFSSPGHTVSTGPANRQSVPSFVLQPRLDDRVRSEKTPSGFPSSAQNAPKQFGNVEEMTKKLDTLLEGIQGKGGFIDQCITSQESNVAGLEEGTRVLDKRCKTRRGLLDDQSKEIQLLLDKTVQVLARKEYMEGIFKQITDKRYWELWNRQKLSSELELKRRCILDLNQELTNQLIELERHFNALELNRFGESGGTLRNRNVSKNRSGHSRQIQSLNTLHNTMIAQLAAAEQLAGCLSEQMSALKIESSAKNDAKKKLFESIGLSDHSSVKDTKFSTPDKAQSIASYSAAAKERNQVSNSKIHEAETARRRRDSLDRSWTTFEPPKTTVSRIRVKDVDKSSASRSVSNIDRHYRTPQSQKNAEIPQAAIWSNKSKGTAEIAAKQSNESPLSLFQKRAGLGDIVVTQGSSSPTFPVFAPQSIFKPAAAQNSELGASTPPSIFKTPMGQTSEFRVSPPQSVFKTALAQNSELGGSRPMDEKSKDTIPFSLNTDSFADSKSKLFQQPTSNITSQQSKSTWQPEQSLTSPFQSTQSLSNSKLGFTKSFLEPSKPVVDARPSSTSSLSVLGPSSNSKNTSPSFSSFAPQPSSQISFPVSSSSDANVITKPVPSTSSLSTPLFSNSTPSPSTISGSESPTPVSDPLISRHGSKAEQNASTLPSVANVSSKVENDLKIQASTSQTVSDSITNRSLGPPALPTSSEALTNSNYVNQDDLSNSIKSAPIVRSDSEAEQPLATETPAPVEVSSVGNFENVINVVSNESLEEEMEEEAPETNQTTGFSLGNLSSFGLGSNPNPATSSPNPFGVSNPSPFGVSTPNSSTSLFQMPTSDGQLFKPASFDFQSPQTSQPQQQTNVNSFSGGFVSANSSQVSVGSGFGQPAQMGVGQKPLDSMLGAFGSTRQVGLGVGLPGSGGATPSGFAGGFGGVSGGGFSSAPTGGGFAALASGAGGGFAPAGAGGGFTAAAGGGFASLSGSGPAVSGGGFGAFNQQGSAGGGGFGTFNPQGGAVGGFSGFGGGGGSGAARPPSDLFTQMRR